MGKAAVHLVSCWAGDCIGVSQGYGSHLTPSKALLETSQMQLQNHCQLLIAIQVSNLDTATESLSAVHPYTAKHIKCY